MRKFEIVEGKNADGNKYWEAYRVGWFSKLNIFGFVNYIMGSYTCISIPECENRARRILRKGFCKRHVVRTVSEP